MITGILGGGFGLYGYLPALVELGDEILLPSRYKEKFDLRPELIWYKDSITFVEEKDVFESSEELVIAKNPQGQAKLLKDFAGSPNRVWLEKPLAPTVSEHSQLLKIIGSSQYLFSVGYIFPFTTWWNEVTSHLNSANPISLEIEWRMLSPGGWKKEQGQGGGLRSFYGIHFCPLLSIPGIRLSVFESEQMEKQIFFILTSKTGATVEVKILFSNYHFFRISYTNDRYPIFEDLSPFGRLPKSGDPDPRIPMLSNYISSSRKRHSNVESLELENLALDLRTKSTNKLKMDSDETTFNL